MANYVLDEELKKLVTQVCRQFMNSFQPRPRRGRRNRRSGGGDNAASNLTTFAIVVQSAAKNDPLSYGECVLLDKDMRPLDANGNLLVIDPADPAFNQAKLDAVTVEFRCAQVYAACRTKARIWLSSTKPIKPGNSRDDGDVWGVCVDAVDYLYDLLGAAERTSLAIPEGGTKPADIHWLGGTC